MIPYFPKYPWEIDSACSVKRNGRFVPEKP